MRHTQWVASIALVALVALSGCLGDEKSASAKNGGSSEPVAARITIPSGTSIEVTLNTSLSSKEAHVGDSWSGTVATAREGIPAGSTVHGTVTGAKPAVKGDRAMLDLGLSSIVIDGQEVAVHGGTEPIIAGSPRARNLGAIAGSTVGGALIGKAVTGTTKGAVVGGVVGGAVATGVVAKSDGYQVLLKPGITLVFVTSEQVAIKE